MPRKSLDDGRRNYLNKYTEYRKTKRERSNMKNEKAYDYYIEAEKADIKVSPTIQREARQYIHSKQLETSCSDTQNKSFKELQKFCTSQRNNLKEYSSYLYPCGPSKEVLAKTVCLFADKEKNPFMSDFEKKKLPPSEEVKSLRKSARLAGTPPPSPKPPPTPPPKPPPTPPPKPSPSKPSPPKPTTPPATPTSSPTRRSSRLQGIPVTPATPPKPPSPPPPKPPAPAPLPPTPKTPPKPPPKPPPTPPPKPPTPPPKPPTPPPKPPTPPPTPATPVTPPATPATPAPPAEPYIPKLSPISLQNVSNGPNMCWLNSSLYAFVSQEAIMNLHHKFIDICDGEPNTRVDDTQAEEYNKVYELLEEIQSSKVWNEKLYTRMYNLLKEFLEMDELAEKGSYGNPQPVITYFVDVILSNCNSPKSTPLIYKPLLVTESNDIPKIIKENGKTFILTSFVLSDNPTKRFDDNEQEDINFGHWIAFARIDSENYRYFDGLKRQTQDVKLDTHLTQKFKTLEEDEIYQFIGLYVELEHLSTSPVPPPVPAVPSSPPPVPQKL